jgi:hypothetical protein
MKRVIIVLVLLATGTSLFLSTVVAETAQQPSYFTPEAAREIKIPNIEGPGPTIPKSWRFIGSSIDPDQPLRICSGSKTLAVMSTCCLAA